jgi:hypothetical protein
MPLGQQWETIWINGSQEDFSKAVRALVRRVPEIQIDRFDQIAVYHFPLKDGATHHDVEGAESIMIDPMSPIEADVIGIKIASLLQENGKLLDRAGKVITTRIGSPGETIETVVSVRMQQSAHEIITDEAFLVSIS